MRKPAARGLLLVMGTLSAATYVVQALTGHRTDDALLVFAGSMFTTYALTEKDDDDDDHRRLDRYEKRQPADGD